MSQKAWQGAPHKMQELMLFFVLRGPDSLSLSTFSHQHLNEQENNFSLVSTSPKMQFTSPSLLRGIQVL